jgi:hypothetical protein
VLVLAAADTLAGVAGAASQVTCTIFGMELNAGTETYKVLDQRQLAAAAATIYTAPDSTVAFVKSIHVVNNDTAARSFQLFRGGTVAANAITPAITLQPGGYAVYSEGAWKTYNSFGMELVSFTPMINGLASLAAATAAIANSETQVLGVTLPANFLQVGTTIGFMFGGVGTTSTSPGSTTWRVRCGAASLSGNIAASVAPANTASRTAMPWFLKGLVTCRSIGGTGSIIGQMEVRSSPSTSDLYTTPGYAGALAATVAVDTTAARVLELTVVTGAASSNVTAHNGCFFLMKA